MNEAIESLVVPIETYDEPVVFGRELTEEEYEECVMDEDTQMNEAWERDDFNHESVVCGAADYDIYMAWCAG